MRLQSLGSVLLAAATCWWGAAGALDASAADTARPGIQIVDEARGCPGIDGRFVALLDPKGGVLLLSAAPFPGGREVGYAAGHSMSVAPAGGREWRIERVNSIPESRTVWAAAYPLEAGNTAGCVAFEKERFSSEGDLVTYLQWLVAEVYLELPATVRPAAFRLANRKVELSVEQPGFKPMRLSGREGSTLAFRTPDSDRVILMRPLVLDEDAERIVLMTAISDQAFWRQEEKQRATLVVVSINESTPLPDAAVSVRVERVVSER